MMRVEVMNNDIHMIHNSTECVRMGYLGLRAGGSGM